MEKDAFSRFHPAVNFCFFAFAIGFAVVIQHPMYLLAGLVCAAGYYLMLSGRRGWRLPAAMVPMVLLVGVLNPLTNTRGETVLFLLFGRPYTFEALCYGAALGVMFALMMLWFGSYNLVLTSDKFVCLFGPLIPSLSLLLVMVLRLIPSFMRKTRQISSARESIGRGGSADDTIQGRVRSGMTTLSALTDWALEGSIVTADSMRSRGYGAAKRTSYRIYRMTLRDWVMLALELALGAIVIAGGPTAEYAETITLSPITWHYAAYWALLMIPIILAWKEAIQWRILRSKI